MKVVVISFLECPNADLLVNGLKESKISFENIIQNDLPKDDLRKNLSSPSVFVNGVQIVGTKLDKNTSSCTYMNDSIEMIIDSIRKAIQ
jgi:hypothetical protein